MSSTPAAKRRLLADDAATRALKRPFVSPLRSSSGATPLKHNHNASNFAHTSSPLAQSITARPFERSFEAKSIENEAERVAVTARVVVARKIRQKPDPTEQTLQRSLTRLEMRSRALQNEIDALNQAITLQASSTDADLIDLTLKWTLASQAAAEELFGTVKERVNRMGGVAAWRHSERNKHDRAGEFGAFDKHLEDDDADCEFDSQGEELPEEEQKWRKAQKRIALKEAREAADVVEPPVEEKTAQVPAWKEADGDDETFTMDMMLRSLNVELDLIGYDRHLQKWVT